MTYRRFIVRNTIAATLAMSAAFVPAAGASAQSVVRPFSIPAGDLQQTIERISAASGTRILFDPNAIAAHKARKVQRATTAREALLQALAGQDLAIRAREGGVLEVFRNDAAVEGDIVVTAQRDEAETNYRVNKASSSNRSGGDLRKLAQNTAVVSDKLIRDQQAQTLTEALRNVAGAVTRGSNGSGLTGFSIRGFDVAPVTNGVGQTAVASFSGSSAQSVAITERVEVLKGPAAILAGQGSLGGTINIVTKRPTANPLLIVTGEYQSNDSYRGIIDASNALTADKQLSARIILEGQHAARNFGGYDGRHGFSVAPTLRFKNENTDIVAGLSVTEQYQPATNYTIINTFANAPVAIGKPVPRPDAPIGRRNSGLNLNNTRFFGEATQEVASWLQLTARGEHYKQDLELTPVSSVGATSYGKILAFNSRNADRSSGNSFDGFARAKLDTIGISHTVVAGFNYTDLKNTHFDALSGAPLSIDILNPTFRIAQPRALLPAYSFILDYTTHAGYVQDLIEYGPVHFSVAYRKNWYEVGTTRLVRGTTTRVGEKKTSGVPAFGLVVDLASTISVYGNYSKGYNPTTVTSRDGTVLPDVRSTNKEVGLKADLFRDRASLVVSLFETEQDNRIVPDLANPGFSTTIPGGQRARGVDATFTGQVVRNLNVNATYTYSKFDFADPAVAAARGLLTVEAQPAHTYSVFASYDRPSALVGGALGAFGRSSSTIQDFVNGKQTVFDLDGGFQIDGNVYFNIDKFRLNLGLKNILNKRLYLPTNTVNAVSIIDYRTFTATLTYRFY